MVFSAGDVAKDNFVAVVALGLAIHSGDLVTREAEQCTLLFFARWGNLRRQEHAGNALGQCGQGQQFEFALPGPLAAAAAAQKCFSRFTFPFQISFHFTFQ
jgi:hypothetical protein